MGPKSTNQPKTVCKCIKCVRYTFQPKDKLLGGVVLAMVRGLVPGRVVVARGQWQLGDLRLGVRLEQVVGQGVASDSVVYMVSSCSVSSIRGQSLEWTRVGRLGAESPCGSCVGSPSGMRACGVKGLRSILVPTRHYP